MFCSHIHHIPILQRLFRINIRTKSTTTISNKFETVFKLPSIRFIALIHRLKVYHLFGTSIALPTCGAMEIANIIPEYSFLTASYIGLTGAAVLTLASVPLQNVIGFLYISEDNQLIKISFADFWGKRRDRIVKVDEWIPLNEMKSKITDIVFLTPKLTDGTKYKLLVKFGTVLNSRKIGEVLE